MKNFEDCVQQVFQLNINNLEALEMCMKYDTV